MTEILFAPVGYGEYSVEHTLPKRFERIIDAMCMDSAVKNKWTAIKMHLGRNVGYTTIHPIFIKILTDRLKKMGAKVFITDHNVKGCADRGYTEQCLGAPVVPVCGVMDRYYYTKQVKYNTFTHVDIGGNIYDADVLIDLSHVKGHGVCGYGGACKNIAMGCVTDRTRMQIHSLEGGLDWDKDACTHCGQCIQSCNHNANSFDSRGNYKINFHHCTYCQHCSKVCPTQAIKLDGKRYEDFQQGMAICTDEVLKTFDKDSVFYINFLTNITALCDCWGFTLPNLVPDIGIMAGSDIVAVERACLDAIKIEHLIPEGVPGGKLEGDGHLLERLHGKNPFVQLTALEQRGLGSQQYTLKEIR